MNKGGDLDGKVAIVTGGAKGLGRAMVSLFVEHGAQVVIADRDRHAGEALARELGQAARFVATDMADASEVQALIDRTADALGRLDVMVNNAAVASEMHPRFLDETFDDFDRVLRINLLGVMLGTQRAARQMATQGGGSIVNVSATSGITAGFGVACYRVAKAGVIQLSKSAAIDLAEYGVRVNVIAPGNIETDMNSFAGDGVGADALGNWRRERDTVRLASQPLKRQGSPKDVAEAALYLASDRSAQVTGATIPVDGGVTAGDPTNHLEAILTARANFASTGE